MTIHLTDITKQRGDKSLLTRASFQVLPQDRIGLVGPNGSGKTTLFRLIMGEEYIDSGIINIPNDTVIGYFSQDVGAMNGRSALEEVKAGAGKVALLDQEISQLEKKLD